MRYPKHIILDLKTSISTSPYLSCDDGAIRLPTLLRLNSKKRNFSYSPLQQNPLSISNLTKDANTDIAPSQSFTLPLFNIHFIRKEKLYTKLKYSRCPQYDMVSGGFAALLAGFVGFLISEKFGIELVDSGDFYNAFMYGVFASFSLRPLVRIYSKDDTLYSPISLKYLLSFIRDLLKLLLNSLLALLRAFRKWL